jgi:hypothetical protein
MAVSPASQTAAKTQTTGAHPLLRLIAETGTHDRTYTQSGASTAQPRHWEIYQVADSAPVAGLSYDPAVMRGVAKRGLIGRLLHDVWPWYKKAPGGRQWINAVVPWYQDSSRWDVPLAASGPSSWPRVTGASSNPPRVAVPTAVVTNVSMTDDRIGFDVDRIGSPVLVKTSYFPNWQASGADGPWRVGPNLMVVVPTSRHVSLHYGFTPVDDLGRFLSLGGLAAVVVLWRAEGSGPGVVADAEEGDPLAPAEPAAPDGSEILAPVGADDAADEPDDAFVQPGSAGGVGDGVTVGAAAAPHPPDGLA